MLAAIDLRREDVFITNTIKCRATLFEDGRLKNRVQLTTDGYKPYLAAVEDAFPFQRRLRSRSGERDP